MYFIVKGVVEIRDQENEVLNTLKQGQNFGEMALLNESNPVRMAHAVSQTMVSLAVLTKEDFRSICEFYPEFRMKMSKMVKFRINMNRKIQEHRRISLNGVTAPGVNRALEVI
jgi:signal-transduction protein with cAMP-binding, CBS, and nucleotidyltransferase domain